jgi:hypothetical protein
VGLRVNNDKKNCRIAYNVKDYNMRKETDQSQTGFTWDKPINEHNSLYAMMYAGRRHVVQYQSILENFLIKTKSTDLISAFYLETR